MDVDEEKDQNQDQNNNVEVEKEKDKDKDENEYLEYKKNVKKPKKMTHKQRMKMHKKNLKKLPRFLSNKNVKKDLLNQMNSYDSFFKGNKFTSNQLTTYSKSIRKLRKNKKTKKLKKIALTNQIQYMNVLFNADRKLNSLSGCNLMKATPQNYVKMFETRNLSSIWNNTAIPKSTKKNGMIQNINSIYHSFLLHGLIYDFRKTKMKKKRKKSVT